MALGKKILGNATVQQVIGFTVATYLKFVRQTSRFELEHIDILARFWTNHESCIAATWHGQNLLLPTFWHNWREMRILVSRHGDGEIVANIMRNLGVGLIRGSGVPKGEERPHKRQGKGGAVALRGMVRALNEDISIGMTADMPPGPGRQAGDGIVMLARLSGRPIVPVAGATSRRIQFKNWDRFTINLPFSRGIFIVGQPIYVPRDIDEKGFEACRKAVEDELNRVTDEADRLVGHPV